MKIRCVETFEQGQSKIEGGMFRMSAGSEYVAEKNEHGYVVTIGGRSRTLGTGVVKNLVDLGLIVVE